MALCRFLLLFCWDFFGPAFGYSRTLSGENSTRSLALVLAAVAAKVCVSDSSGAVRLAYGTGLSVTNDDK